MGYTPGRRSNGGLKGSTPKSRWVYLAWSAVSPVPVSPKFCSRFSLSLRRIRIHKHRTAARYQLCCAGTEEGEDALPPVRGSSRSASATLICSGDVVTGWEFFSATNANTDAAMFYVHGFLLLYRGTIPRSMVISPHMSTNSVSPRRQERARPPQRGWIFCLAASAAWSAPCRHLHPCHHYDVSYIAPQLSSSPAAVVVY